MNKQKRRSDIYDRLSAAIAERTIQPKGSTAYSDLTKIIKDIRKEYQNGVKTRTVMCYDCGKYYGINVGW